MKSAPIKMLLADDHMVVRKGIVMVLDGIDDIEVIAEARTGEEAIALAADLKPDMILMDVKLAGIDGIEATRRILRSAATIGVIGLSTFADRETVAAMLDAGARGYLLKDTSAPELIEAIRRVHAGEILYPAALMEPSVEPAQHALAGTVTRNALGEQQVRVLALMTKGFTNPEIADRLAISHPTARYHVSAILRKLDVSTRSEAVAMAIRLHLVQSGDF